MLSVVSPRLAMLCRRLSPCRPQHLHGIVGVRVISSVGTSVDDPSDSRSRTPTPRPARVAPSPPADASAGEPSLGESELLLDTQEKVCFPRICGSQADCAENQALSTPGLTFTDGHGLSGPTGKGRQTRRMNLYQAIRDALGWASSDSQMRIDIADETARLLLPIQEP